MKRLLQLAFACTAGWCCNQPVTVQAQDTWDIGNTTLTETNLATGIDLPWEILWGPDDMIWCTTRPGVVLRIDPATGNYTTILDKSADIYEQGSGEPGMLGMALHPDFVNTPKVYIVYCYGSGWTINERLSVFDWDGAQLVNEQYLIDEIPAAQIHDGSRLLITPDQKLLMSTGDTGDGGVSSQDITALNGKILRINLDGSIPADNPDPTSYTFSFGHRNSQGLCNGPNGIIYESEHGQSNSDEFNILEAGRNFGWPSVEGACNTAAEITFCEENNVKEPLKEWSPCVAVNGITYYDHPAIPDWQNCVIMAVLGGLGGTNSTNDRISILHMSTDGLAVVSEEKFFTELNQRFRDVCVNPYTGSLYVALNGTQYPGNGPNIIKEFRNMDYEAVDQPGSHSSQDIKVYPSPAHTNLTVEVSASFIGAELEILSFNGAQVQKQLLEQASSQINLTGWTSGQYFLRATSALGTITKTFIVE